MKKARASLLVSLCVPLAAVQLLAACGGPSAEEVSERTSSVVGELILRTGRAFNSHDNREAIKRFGELVGPLLSAIKTQNEVPPQSSSPTPPYPDSVPDDDYGAANDSIFDVDLDGLFAEEGSDEMVGQMRVFLQQAVFTEQNIESSSSGKTTFLLPAELLCGGVLSGGSDTAVASADSNRNDEGPFNSKRKPNDGETSSCPFYSPQFSIRIDASFVGDGVALAFRIGNGSKALVTLVLDDAQVSLRIDLEAVKDVLVLVEQATGKGLGVTISELRGLLEFSLTFSATDGLVIESSILEAVSFAMAVDQRPLSLYMGATSGLASLKLEAGQMSVDTNAGPMDLQFAADLLLKSLFNASPAELLQITSAGGQGKISMDAQGKLTVQSVALSASELRYGQAVVASVDINPESGRSLQVSLQPLAAAPSVALSPELDLRVTFKFDVLNPFLAKPAPSWAANETYRVLISDAANAPVVAFLQRLFDDTPTVTNGTSDADSDTKPQQVKAVVRMDKGSLSLESTVIPVKINVAEGQCLLMDEATEASTALGYFSAGTCPQ